MHIPTSHNQTYHKDMVLPHMILFPCYNIIVSCIFQQASPHKAYTSVGFHCSSSHSMLYILTYSRCICWSPSTSPHSSLWSWIDWDNDIEKELVLMCTLSIDLFVFRWKDSHHHHLCTYMMMWVYIPLHTPSRDHYHLDVHSLVYWYHICHIYFYRLLRNIYCKDH